MQETQDLELRNDSVRRAMLRSIATVAAGHGQLGAARTVSDHVRAVISLAALERQAAFICHVGNHLLTQKRALHSESIVEGGNFAIANDIEVMLDTVNVNGGGPQCGELDIETC